MERIDLESLQADITAHFGRIRGLFAGVHNPIPHALRTRFVPQPRPPGAGPRILLLTSTLGSGHLSATQAVESALLVRQPAATVCTLDFWSLMDPGVARTIRNAYLRLVQEHPELYDNVYQLDQGLWRDLLESNRMPPAILTAAFDFFARACAESVPQKQHGEQDGKHHESDRLLLNLLCSSLPGRAKSAPANSVLLRLGLIKWIWKRLGRRLETHLQAFSPDAIVATQMAPAALLASIRKHRKLDIPMVSVPTDFGVHDFWARRGVDMYCVPHETVANLQSVEPSRVVVTGIPLKPGFRRPPSAKQAQADLGLDPHRPVVLVPGGGLGLGVDDVIAKLLSGIAGVQLLALTGSNTEAQAALAPLTARYPSRLHVHGWTDRMEVFLRAADLVVGKPGGLTVAEALACGRPLFATHSLRGQEGFNVRFLEQHRVGCLVSDEQLVPRIASLLADRDEPARIQRRAWALGRRDGADRIADLVLATAEQTVEAT